ncbi:MAG: prepilin-type N-terminal cleavage/methylation domain-containing protein [Desulfopila sp.]
MVCVCPGSRPGRGLAGRRGFTLLEMLVVLVLLGILLVVSVPALRNAIVDDPLRSAARKMIGAINDVRQKAISGQQPYLLHFDLDENRLWVEREEGGGETDRNPQVENLWQLPEEVKIREVWQKRAGRTRDGVVEVWVSGRGYMDQTVIGLEDSRGNGLSLVAFAFLPEIEVHDGDYEPR